MAMQVSNDLILQVAAGLDDALVSEYQAQARLHLAQPVNVQRMLELQAGLISRALIESQSPLLFNLPDQVACAGEGGVEWMVYSVPRDQREQKVGGLMDTLAVSDLSRHIKDLEASADKPIANSGRLIRYAVARHLVHRQLPVPQRGNGRSPTPAYALDFFMPQLVAFDEQDNLLVNSVDEAKARIAAMQRFLSILRVAKRLAPYIGVDEEFQRKQYGILAQLINQGRALARHQTGVMIRTIRKRAGEHSLDRGFSLSLPYFDDQALENRFLNFEVVPHGRIMFVPAFVVIAAKLKEMEVAHSPGFNFSTRDHLLEELRTLEQAFDQ